MPWRISSVSLAYKTGSVRVGKVVLDNGHTYIFTQIGANDFKGSWTLYSKRFNPNKTIIGGDNNANETVVTFGESLKKETLTDAPHNPPKPVNIAYISLNAQV